MIKRSSLRYVEGPLHDRIIYKETEDDHDLTYEATDPERFDIMSSIKPLKSIPLVIKPEDDILRFIVGVDKKYDVAVILPKDAYVVYIKEIKCYMVTTSEHGREMMIFKDDENASACFINFVDLTGEILYPSIKHSIQFKLELFRDFFGSIDYDFYVLKEFMLDNDKTKVYMSTRDILDLKKSAGEAIGDGISSHNVTSTYLSPIFFTSDGLKIAPWDNTFTVYERYSYSKNYANEAIYNFEYEKFLDFV